MRYSTMVEGSIQHKKRTEMGKYADTVVVGNAVYDQGASVLKDTVDAVQ